MNSKGKRFGYLSVLNYIKCPCDFQLISSQMSQICGSEIMGSLPCGNTFMMVCMI